MRTTTQAARPLEHAGEGSGDEAAARAEMHDLWAELHGARATLHELRGEGADESELVEPERRAAEAVALAAEQRIGAAEHRQAAAEEALDREIDVIAAALDEHGETDRRELARLVGARYWGPGRFGEALREAGADGRIRRVSRTTYAPPDGNGGT